MKDRLTADVIDDGEEILFWFAENGVDMIDEIIEARKENVEPWRNGYRTALLTRPG